MDLLENLKPLADKALVEGIAREAVEGFCREFEVLEGILAGWDQEEGGRRRLGGRGKDDGEEEEEEEEVVLLRDVYPRTMAEVRVLLS